MDEDVYERRRRQLQKLIDTLCEGNQSAFARQVDTNPNYVSRILSGKPTDAGGKRLGEALAREWERKLGLPRFYFDLDDAEVQHDLREEIAALKEELKAVREALQSRINADTGRWRLARDVNESRDRDRHNKKK